MSDSSSSEPGPVPPNRPRQDDIDELLRSLDSIAAESPDLGSRVLAEGEASLFESAKQDFDIDQHDQLERALKRVQLESDTQDIEQRKKYALLLYVLLACWMAFVAICFLLAGFGRGVSSGHESGVAISSGCHILFELSDTVLLALLTGATINLIALFAIVAFYLFPKKAVKSQDAS